VSCQTRKSSASNRGLRAAGIALPVIWHRRAYWAASIGPHTTSPSHSPRTAAGGGRLRHAATPSPGPVLINKFGGVLHHVRTVRYPEGGRCAPPPRFQAIQGRRLRLPLGSAAQDPHHQPNARARRRRPCRRASPLAAPPGGSLILMRARKGTNAGPFPTQRGGMR
jgi:hypothetical protein